MSIIAPIAAAIMTIVSWIRVGYDGCAKETDGRFTLDIISAVVFTVIAVSSLVV